jgi:hypothetical protein
MVLKSNFQEEMIQGYASGLEIVSIAKRLSVSCEFIEAELLNYCKQQRHKRTFTEQFKKVLAERDMCGVPRTTIAKEMGINANTVKKSCEQFGQEIKVKANNENSFTKIEGVFPKTQCPECHNTRYNEVNDNTYYCCGCGGEYIHKKDHVLRVNWEYVD